MKNIKLIASFLILGFTSLSTYTIDWNDNEGHHNVQSTHHAESVFINGQYLSNWYYYTDTETLDTIHFRPNAEEWHSKRNE